VHSMVELYLQPSRCGSESPQKTFGFIALVAEYQRFVAGCVVILKVVIIACSHVIILVGTQTRSNIFFEYL